MAAAEPVWDGPAGDGRDDMHGPWLRAARCGPADPRIGQASRQCFEAADAALGRSGAPGRGPAGGGRLHRTLRTQRPMPGRRPTGRSHLTEPSSPPRRCASLIARELTGARQRTALLTDCVDDTDLVTQHSPLMSPLVWDLAHIANQEELWLLREVGGREPMHPEIDPLYDAFEHPRAERPTLPLLPPAQARAYGHEVRGRVLDLLDQSRFDSSRARGHAAARRRVRVRDDRPARGAARRDDADHPPDPGRRPGAVRPVPRPGARRCVPAAGRGPGARRPVHAWGPRPSRGHWTTNGPRTPCRWRRSSSIPRR